MVARKIPIAIAYDFDGTLAPGYMQQHVFLPEVGSTPEEFWPKVKRQAKATDGDEILAYMHMMIREADHKDAQITKQAFIDRGRGLPLFPGVDSWFDRINKYAGDRNGRIDHYIISSGLREIVEGTSIIKKFKYVFASGFHYNASGVAVWPALAVNYTTKTQYLFRINKNVMNSWDNEPVNKYFAEKERPTPFTNIIFIGDGETDVPAMKMTRYQGGHAIAVYEKGRKSRTGKPTPKNIAEELVAQERANFARAADYSLNSDLDKCVKAIIDKITSTSTVSRLKRT